MPGNEPPDPGIQQTTIDQIANMPAASVRLTVASSQWAISTAGFTMPQPTYDKIRVATANTDGSWTSGGVRYWLHPNTVAMTATYIEA